MDKNALVSAIESPGKDALGALGNRRPVVSPRVREEFLAGSPDLRKRLGDAGARRHQEKVLERFLRKHDGRIGPTPSASAMTPFQVPGVIKGDPHALASAQMEGLRLLTRDKKAIKNFPALTERF